MKKLIIFDGNSVVNRAFYGVRLLTNKAGIYTNAVYGFLNILLKYMQSEKPDYLVIAFDEKKPTFRHEQFEGYKAQRKGMPEELAMQMPVLKEVLSAMNISMLSAEGYEADDIIGTVAKQCEEKGMQCIIATGDRDSLQLATENTSIYLTSTKMGNTQTEVMTTKEVENKYGVMPPSLIDIKGLMGDSSDNIPGVAGIGEKTACKLISEYGSLEGVYENIENISGSVKSKLEKDKDMAFLSRILATIDKDVPLQNSIEEFTLKEYDNEKLIKLLSDLEFKSILNKLDLKAEKKEEKKDLPVVEKQIIDSAEDAALAASEILKNSWLAYYLFADETGLASVSVLTEKKYYYFSFGAGLFEAFTIVDIKQIFEYDIKKFGHNIKDDIILLKSYDIELKNVTYDTAIAEYIIDCTRSNYDLGLLEGFDSTDNIFGKGKKKVSAAMLEPQKVSEYGFMLTAAIMSLKQRQEKIIGERGQEDLLYNVELPLSLVLADMELMGFKIDGGSLREFGKNLGYSIDVLEKAIYNSAGGEFNINSPKQLGEVLFEKLQLPVIRKTKTGYSTDSDVLERLSDKHEIIVLIKEYRTLIKLKSTYADGLYNVINKQDGKIHSKFNQTVTATGRISSTEPNLQNIPVRMEIGREIRKMFIAQNEDYVLLDADYSQVELRILAHIAGDEAMIEAFKNNMDIHTITASQVFHTPANEVTSKMRSAAKAVNFGIVYGISDFALAGDLKITRKMAKEYIESYLERYPKVKQYMLDIVEQAKQDGYVTTIMNRRRYIPELKSQKFVERSFGERVALNTPIQGSAADIIKAAMVKVYKALKEKGLKSHLLLQVHDELIVEAHKDEAEQVAKILKENMEQAVTLSVPLIADVHEGENWYDAKA